MMKNSNTLRLGAMIFASVAMMRHGLAQEQTAPAAPRAQPQGLTIHVIKEGKLYWVEGGGGNSGVIVGDRGVVVIDAKTTPEAGAQLVTVVAKLTPKPITHVIETHSDGDHVNGLAGFPDGLKIIAHENNKMEQMAVYQFAAVEIGGGKCIPPANRLPNMIVFKESVPVTIDGERFVIHHFGPAHTSGDLVIELPEYRVAFVGDLITNSVLIHPEKGGTFEGWFKNAEGLLSLRADSYVGGHAKDVNSKEDLRKIIADNQSIRAKVDALVDAKKSLAEVKAAMGDPPKDPSGCRGIPYLSLPNIEFNEHTDRSSELK
jgi:glyoxylase-like metal-dependent hydrolase (beta-lactamase superfamily II)